MCPDLTSFTHTSAVIFLHSLFEMQAGQMGSVVISSAWDANLDWLYDRQYTVGR